MEIKVTVDLSDRVIRLVDDLMSSSATLVDALVTMNAQVVEAPKAKKTRAKKAVEPENPTPTVTTPAVPADPELEVSPDGLVTGTSDVQVDIPPATEAPVTRNSVIQSLTKLAPAGYTEQCKALIQKFSVNERKDLAGVPANQLTALKADLDALSPVF